MNVIEHWDAWLRDLTPADEGTTMKRPTIGNTAALGRFSPDGPTGYAPVYRDGSVGPLYGTRAEAEEDFASRECPTCEGTGVVEFFDSDDGADGFWTTVDCHNCHGTGYTADVYGEAEACDECGYEDAVAEAVVAEAGMPI